MKIIRINLEELRNVVEYTAATLTGCKDVEGKPDWIEVHHGRAHSAVRQLESLLTEKVFVDIWEYERGWGSNINETRTFNTQEEAEAFIQKFNAKNNKEIVPDYYEVAKLRKFS